jgi:hypothetical protein
MTYDASVPPAEFGWLWDVDGISEELDLEAVHLDVEARTVGIVVNDFNDAWVTEPGRWRVDLSDVTDLNFVQLSRWLDGCPMSIDDAALRSGMYSLVGKAMTLYARASDHRAVHHPSDDLPPVDRQPVLPGWNGGWTAPDWDPEEAEVWWTTLRHVTFDLSSRMLDVTVRDLTGGPTAAAKDLTFSIGPVSSVVLSFRPGAGPGTGPDYINSAYVDGSTYYLVHPALMLTAVVDGGASATE